MLKLAVFLEAVKEPELKEEFKILVLVSIKENTFTKI
jgi:hypothetical protein